MIIVTGGAGFIGSVIVWALNQRGQTDIMVVDETGISGDKEQNLKSLKYKDYLGKDDFIEKIKKDALGHKIEAIIHMGACSDTTETDEAFLMENNYEYTKTLCEYCVKNKVRFIYASSGATYGDGANGYSDSHDVIDILQPLNLYGKSKQIFDKWAKDNNVLDKIVGLKYFNIYGPNEYHKGEMRSMVAKSFKQIEETGKIRLFKSHLEEYDDGEQKRDFFYVKDAVDMTLFFLDNAKANGVFNIGSGCAHTWNELAKAIFKALGKEPNIEYFDMPDNLKKQYQYFTQADISKLKKAGYNKNITAFEEAIRDYVQNYLIKKAHLS